MLFFYLTFIINNIYSHYHIKIHFLSDEYIKDILINNISINSLVLLNNNKNAINYFSYIIEPKSNLKFIVESSKNYFGLGIKIELISSENKIIYNSMNNNSLFQCENGDYNGQYSLNNINYLNDSYSLILKDLNSIINCTNNNYKNNNYMIYKFKIPLIGKKFTDFKLSNLNEQIFSNEEITIDLNSLLSLSTTLEKLKFYFINNNINNIGNLIGYFSSIEEANEIEFNKLIKIKYIKYIPNINYFYYQYNINYKIGHDDEFIDNQIGNIIFNICPNYCYSCNINKFCLVSNIDNKIKNKIISYSNNIDNILDFEKIIINLEDYNQNILLENNFEFINLTFIISKIKESYLISSDIEINLEIFYDKKNIYYISFFDSNGNILISNINANQISETNFYINITTKTLEKCYEKCSKCFGQNENNCIECKSPYILTSINICISNPCSNLFYINKNNEFICIDDIKCPLNLPYFIKETNECIENCENINNNDLTCMNCKFGTIQKYNNCENMDINILKEIILNNISNYINETIEIKDYIFNIKNYENSCESNYLSCVNLSKCEEYIKKTYNISSLNELIIININNYNESSSISHLEYYAFYKGKIIDLSICPENSINITYNILNTTNIKYDTALDLYQNNNIDIYNISDDFYNNFCNNQDIDKQDLTLDDRKKDIYINLCGEKCIYNGVNYSINKIYCNCYNDLIEINNNFQYNKSKISKFFEKVGERINFKIIKCYKYFIYPKYYKENYGFYMTIIIFFLLNILFIIFLKFWYILLFKKLMKKYEELINEKNIEKNNFKIQNSNSNLTNNNKNNKIKNKNNNIEIYNYRSRENINSEDTLISDCTIKPKEKIQSIKTPNKAKNCLSLEYKVTKSYKKIKNKKIVKKFFYINIFDSSSLLNKLKKSENNNKKTEKNENDKINKINKIKSSIIKNDNLIKKDSKLFKKFKSNDNKIFNEQNNIKINKSINKNSNLSNKNLIHNKNLEINLNKKKNLIDENNYDEWNFFESKTFDKRNIIFLCFNIITNKIEIIKIFFLSEIYEFIPLLISTYLFEFLIDFTLNAFLFSDNIISKKYKNNGNLNFLTQNILSYTSKFIGILFNFITNKLTNYNDNLELMTNDIHFFFNYLNKIKMFLNTIKKRIIIYYIFQTILMCFIFYYLTVFCGLYHYSQKELFETYFTGELTDLIFTFCLCFLISIFRFIALKKNYKKLFLTAQYLNKEF